ncbi:MAG: acyltransferase [Syntrophomonas sp.]
MLIRLANRIKHLKKRLANNEQYIANLRLEGMQIGNGCVIHKRAIIGTEPYLIKIGDNVRITRGVKFITHDGGMWTLRKMGLLENADRFGEIYIGDNSNIGWDVTIMPGVSIGKNCVIGCGAIVTKNIPDNSIAVGVPAKVIETIEEYYLKNKESCVFTKNLNPEEKKKFLLDMYS